jgi:sporulation protein YlmC with PRC-barrel domain
MLSAAALGLCLANVLSAQERQPAERQPAERVRPGDAAAAADTNADGFVKASDLIGMKIQGTGNAELGSVEDLVINSRTNEIEYLILDKGVFADLGDKQPVIPWVLVDAHFVGEKDAHFLMVPLTAERIKTAPAVDKGELQLTPTAPWIVQVNRFYAQDLRERNVSRPDLDPNSRERGEQPGRERREGADPNRRSPGAGRPEANPDAPSQPRPGTPGGAPRPSTEPRTEKPE